jgi:hypothetical protein
VFHHHSQHKDHRPLSQPHAQRLYPKAHRIIHIRRLTLTMRLALVVLPAMLLLVLLPTASVLLFLAVLPCTSRDAATSCGTDVAIRCRLRSAMSCASCDSVCSRSMMALLTQYSGERSAI